MSQQIDLAKRFVKSTEDFSLDLVTAKELLHPNYEQVEFPNLLNRKGQKSNLTESVARMQIAKKILSSQSYELLGFVEEGNSVVMESKWLGEMAIDAGPLKAGQTIKAFFCMVFEFKEGKIFRVRNYDCFEEW